MADVAISSVTGAELDQAQVLRLYASVGWTAYTATPEVLFAGLAGSTHIVAARLGPDLIGLARIVSDGATVAYLQDVLVHPDHQRRGLGRRLIDAVLEPVAHVRQKVLLTDDEPAVRDFYARLGWTDGADRSLRAFVRLDG